MRRAFQAALVDLFAFGIAIGFCLLFIYNVCQWEGVAP